MKRKILIVIIILTIAFIWGNSLFSQEQSAEQSGLIMKLITPFLELFAGKGNVTHFLVRKLAHFTEHFLLGLELTAFFKGKKYRYFITAFVLSFFVAFMDETIQMFTGRGPAVRDVWIDVAGAACGILLMTVLLFVSSKIKSRHL